MTVKNVAKSVWSGEKRTIVMIAVGFGVWLYFVGLRKYGWKGAGKYNG